MFKLDIQVPADHSKAAIATLSDGSTVLLSGLAAASVTGPDQPELGKYFLIGSAHNAGSPRSEYGDDQLLFYRAAGKTPYVQRAILDGLYQGRALLAYAGDLGADKALRKTQGGIRLTSEMSAAICNDILSQAANRQRPLQLTLRRLNERTWWAFWRSATVTPLLSTTPPEKLARAHDEKTLLEKLLRQFIRTPGSKPTDDRRDDRDSWRDDRSTSSSSDSTSPSQSDSFRGQGGQSGGAGASGGWASPAAGATVAAGAAVATGAALATGAVFAAQASPFTSVGSGGESGWLDSGSSNWFSGGGEGGSSSSDSSSYSSSDSGSFSSDSGSSSSDSGGSSGGD